MKYLYFYLISCCLCAKINKDIFYTNNRTHLKRVDISSYTQSEKNTVLNHEEPKIFEELGSFDKKIPITSTLFLELNDPNTKETNRKKHNISKYKLLNNKAIVTLGNNADFATSVSDIEKTAGVISLKTVPHRFFTLQSINYDILPNDPDLK